MCTGCSRSARMTSRRRRGGSGLHSDEGSLFPLPLPAKPAAPLLDELRRAYAHCDALPCTSSSAACETTSERAHTTCATSSSDGTVTSTRWRLRNDFAAPASSSWTTTTVGVSLPQPLSSATASFVDGVSNDAPS